MSGTATILSFHGLLRTSAGADQEAVELGTAMRGDLDDARSVLSRRVSPWASAVCTSSENRGKNAPQTG